MSSACFLCHGLGMLPLQKVRFRFQQDKSCSLEVVLVDRTKKGTVHSLVTMAGNVATAACCLDLLHGEERKVWDDGGYHGQPQGEHTSRGEGSGYDVQDNWVQGPVGRITASKAPEQVQCACKVEDPFRILKRIFGFEKVRYQSLAKKLTTDYALASR